MALFHINPPKQTVGCHYIKDAIQNNDTKTIPLLLVRKSKNLRIGSYYFLGSSTARQVLFDAKYLRHTNKIGRNTY